MRQKMHFIQGATYRYGCAVLSYFFIIFLCAISFVGFAQNNNIRFEHLGDKSGLSNSNVVCIMQDSRGFMWFGTSDGLNKYDGYQFTVYRNNAAVTNSLSNNSIKTIIEDTDEVIWIGTWGGGLNGFDRRKDTFIHFKHDPANTNSISSDFVTWLLEDTQKNLWIGTGDGGLDLFDRRNNRFIHYIHPNDSTRLGNSYVTSIFEDSQHNLWIGTLDKGLHLLNKSSNTLRDFQHSIRDETSICDNDVNIIFEDSRKNIWIGTNDGGLDLMDRATHQFSHFKSNLLAGNYFSHYDLLSIEEDNNGKFWIGTRNGGLNIFNPKTGLSYNYRRDDLDINSLSGNTVAGIYKDSKGNIWISTLAGGINFVNDTGNEFIHYKHSTSKHSLSDNNVSCIYEDSDSNLWIGTDGGGLNLFNRKAGKFVAYKHQVNNNKSICGDNILSVCEDNKGNLWIGTWATGITVYNKKKNTFSQFKNDPENPHSLGCNNVWAIIKDRENHIWIGTYGTGLDSYDPATNSFTHYDYDEKKPDGINNNQVITIFEDSKGLLWLGTDGGGLNKFDKKTKKFTHFIHHDSSNSLSYNYVSNIFEDAAGNLYITTGAGLNYFNTRTLQFTVYAAADGFTNNSSSAIMQDSKGKLWISTAEGISSFNPVTKKFINFDTEDGLPFNTYNTGNCFKSRSGMMYFGGSNGFEGFFPDSIKKISFDPPLVITDFQVFNKRVSPDIYENSFSQREKDITETKKITIPYSSSVFSFEFASLHYGVTDRKQYAYMLEGFDKTWNYAGTKRTATYTNLDPAKYTFKVKGLNNEGEWSPRIISIQLIIKPPFWLTWWFRSIVLLGITGAAFTFYKFRVNIIKAQKIKLEKRVQEQTWLLMKSTAEEQRARKEAEQANIDLQIKNKEIEQFAYIASHDLQEPLRTTSSFVTLLQKQYQGKFDEKADKYFAFISDASERMKMLIKNLLDFSKIGDKKELEKVDCNKILRDVLADLGTAIYESGADIAYSQLPVINGYATELKQLFQNLISNAIKFTKKGITPEINISVNKDGSYWQFSCKDNGIGIGQQFNEKIFVIFQRLHSQKEYAGSGIGLSHCKKIVELHKGRIWVESKPGEGSTFYFTLPADQEGNGQFLGTETK